jgi:hypothetical protein
MILHLVIEEADTSGVTAISHIHRWTLQLVIEEADTGGVIVVSQTHCWMSKLLLMEIDHVEVDSSTVVAYSTMTSEAGEAFGSVYAGAR